MIEKDFLWKYDDCRHRSYNKIVKKCNTKWVYKKLCIFPSKIKFNYFWDFFSNFQKKKFVPFFTNSTILKIFRVGLCNCRAIDSASIAKMHFKSVRIIPTFYWSGVVCNKNRRPAEHKQFELIIFLNVKITTLSQNSGALVHSLGRLYNRWIN